MTSLLIRYHRDQAEPVLLRVEFYTLTSTDGDAGCNRVVVLGDADANEQSERKALFCSSAGSSVLEHVCASQQTRQGSTGQSAGCRF